MAYNQSYNPRLGLERLCKDWGNSFDRISPAPSVAGLERIEAFLDGRGFAPHRHDTYGIGVTTFGVQCFDYRGVTWDSVRGQIFVLHPDELHDGRSGTKSGFGYRILYIDPALIRDALGGRGLPFLSAPITEDSRMRSAVGAILSNIEDPIDDSFKTDIILSLAEALESVSGGPRKQVSIDQKAVANARDLLIAGAIQNISSSELESVTGLDRWSLARQFRGAFGVSPHRFLIIRRLDCARVLIAKGIALAEVADQVGFADQSHMSRHFKSAYGLPPGVWRSLTRGPVNTDNVNDSR